MKNLLLITFASLAMAACAQTEAKDYDCITLDGKDVVCVDDHIGKDGKEEVKADIVEAVNSL